VVICFDIGNVLLRDCSKRMVWQILRQPRGLRNLLGFLLFDRNRFKVASAIRTKIRELLDHLAVTDGVEYTHGRCPTEHGRPVPTSIQQWQRGNISDEELLNRVLKGLESLSYSSRYEKELGKAVATIVLTPALHVKTKRKIKGIQKLIDDLQAANTTLVITSNIDRGLAQEVRRKFPEIFTHFDTFIGSGHLGVMKPDPAFFQTVVTQYDVAPNRVLVIDDLIENLAAASDNIGCQTFHFANNTDLLRAKLVQLGVL
jgi:HAD superfamily hydrolase (TIGR01509 family)